MRVKHVVNTQKYDSLRQEKVKMSLYTQVKRLALDTYRDTVYKRYVVEDYVGMPSTGQLSQD